MYIVLVQAQKLYSEGGGVYTVLVQARNVYSEGGKLCIRDTSADRRQDKRVHSWYRFISVYSEGKEGYIRGTDGALVLKRETSVHPRYRRRLCTLRRGKNVHSTRLVACLGLWG